MFVKMKVSRNVHGIDVMAGDVVDIDPQAGAFLIGRMEAVETTEKPAKKPKKADKSKDEESKDD